MINMILSNEAIKKYPRYGYNDFTKIENYVIDQIKNHNHGRQFMYHEIERELGYPIAWLDLVVAGSHYGFMLSEESVKNIKK